MSEPFGYIGEPGTCRWCGQRLRFEVRYEEAEPGSNLHAAVCDAIRQLGRRNPSGRYTLPEFGRVEVRGGYGSVQIEDKEIAVECGVRAGLWGRTRPRGKPPGEHVLDGYFHSGECAQQFAHRMAQLGKKLTRQE